MSFLKNNLPSPASILAALMLSSAPALPLLSQVAASADMLSPLSKGYLERARVMHDAGNFQGVIDQLRALLTADIPLSETDRQQTLFLLADALYQQGSPECLSLLREFAQTYPASPLAMQANLRTADYHFFAHQWPEALNCLQNIDFNRLNRDQAPLYTYRLALAQIKTGHYAEARQSLQKIKNLQQYADSYTFYSAYLDYVADDFDKAYEGFSKVKSNEKGLEAEYYLTQIDYRRGKYDSVATRGAELLRKLEDRELAPELNRITGLSLFKTGDYSRADSYLRRYLDLTEENPSADVVYAVGVIDYDKGLYPEAAERFSLLTDLNNDIAQSAWLYLGQCDVKTGNDDAALMAFEKAARMEADRNVSEVALYNYVAALTRGGSVPFTSSVDMLEGFIRLYPNSEYTPKVEEYLATAYYNERDYTKALASIEKIRRPSAKVLAAKQKVLYELGVEAMSNSKPSDAVSYLRRSLELSSHSAELALQTRLWLADAQYALGNFSQAADSYSAFLKGEKSGSNRTLAMYNLAYALYQQDKYAAAAKEFDAALAAKPALPPALEADARIRMADCLYYSGDYKSALSSYRKAIAAGAADADYAAYREAVMLGLSGDVNGKINLLSSFPHKYPESRWLPNALMEKAQSLEALDRNNEAAEAFNALAKAYPSSSQARKAMINLALTYSKDGKKEKAVETYKEIIRSWPSSEEAALANEDLRKYYSSTGNLREYADFLKSVPDARQLSADEMEQLAFEGAETAYADNPADISLLRSYVADYPDGKYLAPALLDMAYSLRENGKPNEAEQFLARLLQARPHSVQYPEALLMRAEILESEIPGQTSQAHTEYLRLLDTGDSDFLADALAGAARTAASDAEAIDFARRARQSGGISAEAADELSLIEAKALLRTGNSEKGVEMLADLAGNPAGKAGAQAAVALGEYYLDRKEYTLAENILLEFTENGTPHQFELAKGFIALADAYAGLGKKYLAKEYLQSLKENYPGKEPEILNAISARLKSLK